jgi:hypothetical protein
MAREPIQKDIDGVKYTFGRHMPKNSLKLFNRILKIVAPSIAAGIGETSFSDILDNDIDLSGAVNALCLRMDEPEIEAIFNIVLGEIVHNGNGEVKGLGNCKINYDAVFMDTGIAHVYKVIYTALSVEYDNFFGQGVSLDAIIKQAKDLIPEKQQSTGSFGDR